MPTRSFCNTTQHVSLVLHTHTVAVIRFRNASSSIEQARGWGQGVLKQSWPAEGCPCFSGLSIATDFLSAFPAPPWRALCRPHRGHGDSLSVCSYRWQRLLVLLPQYSTRSPGNAADAAALAVLLPRRASPAAQPAATRVLPSASAAPSWEQSSNPLPAENSWKSQPECVKSGTQKQPCALTW